MTTNPNTPANEDADAVRTVAPALEHYTETTLSEVWKRPDLSARDRMLRLLTLSPGSTPW
jgi:hypothetical protein